LFCAEPIDQGLHDDRLSNAFEPVLRARSAKVDAALTALATFGRAQLTGSGGGCFIAFGCERDAIIAERALGADFRVWRAGGVNFSPAHARLDVSARCDHRQQGGTR
jgi:4-diphosphocytidyl-2-C-methyl-D-erythritol kinase